MANTFNFGDPNLFVMGVVEQTMFDPNTGDVLGYDRVGSDVALQYTFDTTEIAGGQNNSLVGIIPHTTRMTGTYTSQAFSLQQRALLSGGNLSYNAVAPICEIVTATGTTLTVSNTPAKAYAQGEDDTYFWCQVREHGVTKYAGTNYGVSAEGEVQNFTAESGKQYDVFYFTEWASAQALGLPTVANPSVVTVHQKWGVYAAQNGNAKSGTLQGYMYVIVPLAMLTGDAGADGNQTSNSTTAYNWTAITPNDNAPVCEDCNAMSNNYGYYVYVPCGESTQAVEALAIVGGGVTVAIGQTVEIPVKYVMPDGTITQPVYSDLNFTVGETAIAVMASGLSGYVEGVTAGGTNVTVTLTKADNTVLTAICPVTVVTA